MQSVGNGISDQFQRLSINEVNMSGLNQYKTDTKEKLYLLE